MPSRTTPAQREQFAAQHQRGLTYREIAQAAGVSLLCVRSWCRRLRKGGAATTTYRRAPAGLLQRFDPRVRYVVLRLRREHAHWGPQRLRYHLAQRPSLRGLPLPSPASIGYYLHQWVDFRRPPRPTPGPRPGAPTQVQEQWELDYKMGIPVGDGLVHLVDVRDPVGAAIIGAQVHGVPARTQRLTFADVRADLRQCFDRWQTLPERIQTDNEAVFAGRPDSHFPSPFTLWLVGLGIVHQCIQPGRPTEQAAVERQHRTVTDYALVGCTLPVVAVQAQVDQRVVELNQHVPSQATGCRGHPPLVAHPELLVPRRPFRAAEELAHFDLGRVDRYLAQFHWTRHVGTKGQVKLGGVAHVYSVGQSHAGQDVAIHFDPADRSFVFVDQQEHELRRRPATGLGVHDLTGLAPWPTGLGVQQLPLPFDRGEGYVFNW